MNDTATNIDERGEENGRDSTARTGGPHLHGRPILPILRIALAIMGLLGVTSSALFVWLTQETYQSNVRVESTSAELRAEIQKAREHIELVQSTLDSLTELPDNTKIGLRLTGLEQQISALQAKINVIETAVVESPERAMSIPILRKDLEALALEVQNDIDGVGKEIERNLRLWPVVHRCCVDTNCSGSGHRGSGDGTTLEGKGIS